MPNDNVIAKSMDLSHQHDNLPFTGKGPHRSDPVVVHIRPGETAWVRAPPGVFHLRLAEGRKWFGPKFQFGPSVVGWGGSTAATTTTTMTAVALGGAAAAAAATATATAAGKSGTEATAGGGYGSEPVNSYGTSKWQYPPMWLYRTR